MLPFAANPADSTNANAIQTMRLREDPPPITPAQRTSRKRKSPASNTTTNPTEQQPMQQPPPPPPPHQPPPMHHGLPPMIVHALPGAPPLPPGYHYADFTPGGMPPPNPQPPTDSSSQTGGAAGRALSGSKRAEQNRKAQRAFRERRDQHVKALESRSQLLDAALASADEANRRWEECRTLVDQLRVENAALRAALSQAQQLLPQGAGALQQGQQQQQQPQQNNGNGGRPSNEASQEGKTE